MPDFHSWTFPFVFGPGFFSWILPAAAGTARAARMASIVAIRIASLLSRDGRPFDRNEGKRGILRATPVQAGGTSHRPTKPE